MLKPYAVNDLVPGMMVARVIEQSGPVKIRKVGMIRSPDMIKGLSEMGVSLVEVDLSQSVGIDPQTQEPEPPVVLDEAISATPTQRLVASNKRVADVDRQLSQQFHHSLFLPAVDQMPSKWSLYGKPYGILLLCTVIGFCLGFSITQVPSWLSATTDMGRDISNTSADNDAEANKLAVQDQPSSNNDGAVDTSNDVTNIEAENVVVSESNKPANTDASGLTANSQTAAVQTTPVQAPEEQLVSRNGVIVEEGQQVLGYQTPERESDLETAKLNTSLRANNAEVSSPVNNAELLRRIQEAADEIDNRPLDESPEPLRVTDLNDVQRIDQLPPSLLTQMPSMSFSAHMFASNAVDRWVRVNSRRLGEGEFIANDLQLISIEPERVIMEFKGERFSMNALSDW